MKHTVTILAFVFIFVINGMGQTAVNYFDLSLINNSGFTTIVNIQGTDRIDSVFSKESKTLYFELDEDYISFNLNVWTTDAASSSYHSKTIRVLNTQRSKQIMITPENKLVPYLTQSEKIITDYNPLLRTKNFWRLDTVIEKNSNDIAAAEIIYLSLCDVDIKVDTIQRYFDKLSPAIKSSVFGKRITDYLKARAQLTIGNIIDNISLPDTAGNIVQLNNIQSRYILLDFWFSRCGPCIKSFPELQELYSKTNRADFEIVGISVDQPGEKELWRKTINQHGLSWININDAKAGIARKLAIVNYPTKILLDKNRKIVLVDSDNSYEDFYLKVQKLVSEK
jgi:peroxiredoxin